MVQDGPVQLDMGQISNAIGIVMVHDNLELHYIRDRIPYDQISVLGTKGSIRTVTVTRAGDRNVVRPKKEADTAKKQTAAVLLQQRTLLRKNIGLMRGPGGQDRRCIRHTRRNTFRVPQAGRGSDPPETGPCYRAATVWKMAQK